jgi:hypothetical protein
MAPSRGPNARAAAKLVRLLRTQDRLGEVEEALVALIVTSATLVDATTADSKAAAYAKAAVVRTHGGLIEQLRGSVGVGPGSERFAALIAELSKPS